MSFQITPTNNALNKSTTKIISGGGFKNPSSNPTSGTAKVQQNMTKTAAGNTQDNKTVGTNTARNTVFNYIHGQPKATTFNLPKTAPLAEDRQAAIQDAKDNYKYELWQNTLKAIPRAQSANTQPQTSSQIDTDNTDIGMLMRGIMTKPNPTQEDMDLLDYYNDIRTQKSLNNQQKYGEFLGDSVTDSYNHYVDAYNSRKAINDAYNQQREDYQNMNKFIDEDIALMQAMAQRERDINIKKAEADALEQRRNLVAGAPIADLALQEQLSAMGLGMGANNSSGYGETSRLMSQLATNNQVAQNYNQLEKSKTDYNNAYLDAMTEAHRTGLAQKMDVQKLIAQIGPEAVLALIENEQWNKNFELERKNVGLDNALKEQQMRFAEAEHPLDMALKGDEVARSAIETSVYKDQVDAGLYSLFLDNRAKEQANAMSDIDLRVATATADKQIEATLANYGITIETLNQMYKTNPLEVQQMVANIGLTNAQASAAGSSGSNDDWSLEDLMAAAAALGGNNKVINEGENTYDVALADYIVDMTLNGFSKK